MTQNEDESHVSDEYHLSDGNRSHLQKSCIPSFLNRKDTVFIYINVETETEEVTYNHRIQFSKASDKIPQYWLCISNFCDIEYIISNPSIWAIAIEAINSLQLKSYVAGSIMNLFFLIEQQRNLQDNHCHFLDLLSTSSFSSPNTKEIAYFCSHSALFLTLPGLPTLKPIWFIIYRNLYYFTIYFDYKSHCVWVFECNSSASTSSLYTNA